MEKWIEENRHNLEVLKFWRKLDEYEKTEMEYILRIEQFEKEIQRLERRLEAAEKMKFALKSVKSCLIMANDFGGKTIDWEELMQGIDEALSEWEKSHAETRTE